MTSTNTGIRQGQGRGAVTHPVPVDAAVSGRAAMDELVARHVEPVEDRAQDLDDVARLQRAQTAVLGGPETSFPVFESVYSAAVLPDGVEDIPVVRQPRIGPGKCSRRWRYFVGLALPLPAAAVWLVGPYRRRRFLDVALQAQMHVDGMAVRAAAPCPARCRGPGRFRLPGPARASGSRRCFFRGRLVDRRRVRLCSQCRQNAVRGQRQVAHPRAGGRMNRVGDRRAGGSQADLADSGGIVLR